MSSLLSRYFFTLLRLNAQADKRSHYRRIIISYFQPCVEILISPTFRNYCTCKYHHQGNIASDLKSRLLCWSVVMPGWPELDLLAKRNGPHRLSPNLVRLLTSDADIVSLLFSTISITIESPHLWSNGQRVWLRNQVARVRIPVGLLFFHIFAVIKTFFPGDGHNIVAVADICSNVAVSDVIRRYTNWSRILFHSYIKKQREEEVLREGPIETSALYIIFVSGLPHLTVLGFADDTVIIGKDAVCAIELTRMAYQRFTDIGLKLNPNKSVIINISKDQKYCVLNTSICPLIYQFQTIPSALIPKKFLDDADKLIKSALKEVMNLPTDIPDAMVYSPRKYKGLGIFRTKWEALLQQINALRCLHKSQNPYIVQTHQVHEESIRCAQSLNIVPEYDLFHKNEHLLNATKIRNLLRNREFYIWCRHPQKGKGVVLFKQYPGANKWICKHEGLSNSEWRDGIKMVGNVAAVRAVPGRSQDNRCRHCHNEVETLAHVLGSCPHGEALRNARHHKYDQL
ncbi:hypothetical protein ANN_15878 [Periplaneta americana]|uniref:Reverse transcriptase domain-containing protein n=1 Tax=Periplaneta americana TaxID=6978 RepID=A0ABQ8SHF4_PERAM|nr:hypothetical protein ANN_15878 [Periplaneta americana]